MHDIKHRLCDTTNENTKSASFMINLLIWDLFYLIPKIGDKNGYQKIGDKNGQSVPNAF